MSPIILGLILLGRMVLFISNVSCVLYFSGSGVRRVHVVLSAFRMSLFISVHVFILCRYD